MLENRKNDKDIYEKLKIYFDDMVDYISHLSRLSHRNFYFNDSNSTLEEIIKNNNIYKESYIQMIEYKIKTEYDPDKKDILEKELIRAKNWT